MSTFSDANINWQALLQAVHENKWRMLARTISMVENKVEGYESFFSLMPSNEQARIIGITGPPGAGKSTLVDLLIGQLVSDQKKIAVLCVDPSSPFHFGALLGDRIRMSEWYNQPDVFIRSLATRGSLGGLSPQIIEISDLLKAAGFDYIVIETVGVGQSEVEIAGLADITVVVLVPESGDEIQVMKAGLMEVADIFVVNKSDRPEADLFAKNLQLQLKHDSRFSKGKIPVIKTIASQKKGIKEFTEIILQFQLHGNRDQKILLLAEKAYHLITNKRMRFVDKKELIEKIKDRLQHQDFNLYKLVSEY